MGQPPAPPPPPPTLSAYAPPPPPPPALRPVPPEVLSAGFNWGAFWLHWIWGIAHNVWLSLLVFVAPWPVMQIILALKGNEWAWQNRAFTSVEQFKETQRAWALWGWILAGVSALLVVLVLVFWFMIIGVALMGSAAESAHH